MDAIRMTDVTKRFGSVQALAGVTLRVEQGERVALLGPNGAGKTTAISILLGLRPPTSGEARVLEGDPGNVATRARIGAMLQETLLPPGLRVAELIEFSRSLYPHPLPLAEAVRRSSLEEITQKRVERLSGGQRRRVLFAMAIAGNPELLFLDEPTAGIDAETRQTFWNGLEQSLEQTHGTLLFTTHYLEEAERYATRVVVIRSGRVVAEGTPRELREAAGARTIRFTLPEPRPIEQIKEIAGARSAELSGGTYTLRASDPDAAVRRLVQAGLPIAKLDVSVGSLEEALVRMSEEA